MQQKTMEQKKSSKSHRGTWIVSALAVLAVVLALSFSVDRSGALFTQSSTNDGNLFSTGTLSLVNSKDKEVVVNAVGLVPGSSATGSLALKNSGSYAAVVTLFGIGDESALAQALTMEIEDVTGSAQTVWTGVMGRFTDLPLGTIAAGASRAYRFTVAFPPENASAALSDSTTTMTLRFTGVAR